MRCAGYWGTFGSVFVGGSRISLLTLRQLTPASSGACPDVTGYGSSTGASSIALISSQRPF